MNKKALGAAMLALIMGTVCTASACGKKEVAIRYDDQIKADGSFNENLFYRNDCDIYAPDPMVLKITDESSPEYGYYYLYATNSFTVYRSKDLANWENMSAKVGYPAFVSEEGDFGNSTSMWAPETVYDSETKKYYLFFSMEPKKGNAAVCDETLMCVESDTPYGPFTATTPATKENWQENYFFDMDALSAVLRAKYPERFGSDYEYVSALDPSPYVAPDGTKYLYWVSEMYNTIDGNGTCDFGMKMKSWTEPMYDTVTRLTKVGYTTVDGTERNDCEMANNNINEGPFVYARKQENGTYKYYLTFSVNDYATKSYSMCQAVGDSPLGPFTKLKQADGGMLLGTDNQRFDHLSGPGHHSFVETDGKLYVLYHQHVDVTVGGANRAVSLDEVKFVKNGKGQEVMYVNGPTKSPQLLPEFACEYKNIAPEATIKASTGEDASMLTDGLITIFSYIDYVKEFESMKDVTFTLTFKDYREVTGLMIYNSKIYSEAFDDISQIKIYCREGEETFTGVLKNIPFDWERCKNEFADEMRPGGAVIALFNPISVNKIEITVKVPKDRVIGQDEEGYYLYQEAVALSEIKVIGK